MLAHGAVASPLTNSLVALHLSPSGPHEIRPLQETGNSRKRAAHFTE